MRFVYLSFYLTDGLLLIALVKRWIEILHLPNLLLHILISSFFFLTKHFIKTVGGFRMLLSGKYWPSPRAYTKCFYFGHIPPYLNLVINYCYSQIVMGFTAYGMKVWFNIKTHSYFNFFSRITKLRLFFNIFNISFFFNRMYYFYNVRKKAKKFLFPLIFKKKVKYKKRKKVFFFKEKKKKFI